MRRLLPLTLFLLFFGCTNESEGEWSLKTGESMPSFEVAMENGTLVRSVDLLGSPSLLIFFNTGCSDCRKTIPLVQKAHVKFGDRVRFVAISREQHEKDVRSWWDDNGISIPFSGQEGREVYEKFASSRIPRIYIMNSDGVITAAFDDNPCPTYENLEIELDKLYE